MDRRQRQAALSFLNTISLDGKPVEANGDLGKAENGARVMLSASAPIIRSQTDSGEQHSSKEECEDQTGSTVRTSLLDNESKVNISKELQRSSFFFFFFLSKPLLEYSALLKYF